MKLVKKEVTVAQLSNSNKKGSYVHTEPYFPKYDNWTEDDYKNSNLIWCEPMTAHALEDDEAQDTALSDPNNYIEEKFDGTRGILHFLDGECRVFSRRISKKTNWFTENTDSLPQMRSINIPELKGTIIDGEMFIPDRPFKDVSATLNCKWHKAIDRQIELGFIVFHAFDILYYKGIKLENMRLERRKYYLHKVIETLKKYGINSIVEVPYFKCGEDAEIPIEREKIIQYSKKGFSTKYPTLYRELLKAKEATTINLSPRGYYEYIVASGGEGVIIKNKDCKYVHKRDKAYLKIKKYYTRECVLLGFTKPTREYTGKFPDDRWDYWEDYNGHKIIDDRAKNTSAKELIESGYTPVTRFYYNDWVGNMIFGVTISDYAIKSLAKDKTFEFQTLKIHGEELKFLIVGECSGFDDDLRAEISHDNPVGRVIEVKCNEVFKDTGKLRHPRFLRFRDDKNAKDCTYINHITE